MITAVNTQYVYKYEFPCIPYDLVFIKANIEYTNKNAINAKVFLIDKCTSVCFILNLIFPKSNIIDNIIMLICSLPSQEGKPLK